MQKTWYIEQQKQRRNRKRPRMILANDCLRARTEFEDFKRPKSCIRLIARPYSIHGDNLTVDSFHMLSGNELLDNFVSHLFPLELLFDNRYVGLTL